MAQSERSGGNAKKSVAKPERKPVRGSGADTVYQTLRAEILTLKLEPGTLLDETDLAERFGLSRSPIREALIRLAAEGLVKTLRNRSSIVAPFDMIAIPSFLDASELLYRLTTRLAATNRTQAQLGRIKQLHDQHSQATRERDMALMIRLNREFHLEIAGASGNAFYANWMRQLLDQGQRILGSYLLDVAELGDHDLESHWIDTHLGIVSAIEARDADAAEAAGMRDFETIAIRMQERLTERPSKRLALK
ncbi:GntR family transcriptional regulator [Novosphingobium sp. THN1]|uniref:GntR family transcriptional regulator n=1 Tax=unclassified Novosphingobium TaxID=2644732 RepID=UPI000E484711|nr:MULTISPECIES: GntR family transcriptional regulator [unclassified Novosphingobium]AXU20295.1 GntR family transcriptional regulator [Novosphingobium sp. THN1]NLR41591.1 GntR family transcriptional regulator [Novosphingobium sp. ERW19]